MIHAMTGRLEEPHSQSCRTEGPPLESDLPISDLKLLLSLGRRGAVNGWWQVSSIS